MHVMAYVEIRRTIDAPAELVFKTVAEIENFSKAIPHITDVEFISENKTGLGARFRETRMMGNRPAVTELEVTEHVENEMIRLVADSGGTIWDTVFEVSTIADGKTELTMVMDARPHKLMAKVMNLVIKRMVAKAVENDMDAVKAYCEQPIA